MIALWTARWPWPWKAPAGAPAMSHRQRRQGSGDDRSPGDARPVRHRLPADRHRPDSRQPDDEVGQPRKGDRSEQEHAAHRHRSQRGLVDLDVVGVPGPPAQLRAELVEDLVEDLADEGDGQRPGEGAAPREHAQRPDQFVSELGQRRIERHDVERQPVVHELHREHVVREDETDLLVEAEPAGEVQRRFDDGQVGDGGEPQREVDRIAVAPPPPPGMEEGEYGAADDEQFQDRHGAAAQAERVAERHYRAGVPAREAEAFGDALGGRIAGLVHGGCPRLRRR